MRDARTGDGAPDWRYQNLCPGKGCELCSNCGDSDGCNRFERLKEHGHEAIELLKENGGLSNEEYIKKMRSSISCRGCIWPEVLL